MEFYDTVKNRHSLREFNKKPVSDEDIKKIVELAQNAPSWANSQPWKVYVATDKSLKKIKEQYKDRSNPRVFGTPDFDKKRRTEWAEIQQKNMQHFTASVDEFMGEQRPIFNNAQIDLFHATAVMYLTIPKDSPAWSLFDLGGFQENILLAATDMGIATIPAYEFVKYPDIVRENIDIPDDEAISLGIGLGYPSKSIVNDFRTDRVPVDEILKISK